MNSFAISDQPKQVTAREGWPMSLVCPLEEPEIGSDTIQIAWSKDGRPIENVDGANGIGDRGFRGLFKVKTFRIHKFSFTLGSIISLIIAKVDEFIDQRPLS